MLKTKGTFVVGLRCEIMWVVVGHGELRSPRNRRRRLYAFPISHCHGVHFSPLSFGCRMFLFATYDRTVQVITYSAAEIIAEEASRYFYRGNRRQRYCSAGNSAGGIRQRTVFWLSIQFHLEILEYLRKRAKIRA